RHGKHRWVDHASWVAARIRAFNFGDYRRAIPELGALLRSRGLGEARTQLRADLAVALAHVGRADEARAALRRARRLADDPFSHWLVVWAEAELARGAGRPERALAVIEAEEVESDPVAVMLERCRLWALFEL